MFRALDRNRPQSPDFLLHLFLGQVAQLLRGIILREQPGGHLVHPFVGALGERTTATSSSKGVR